MVFDKIENAERYVGLGARIVLGLEAIPGYTGREPGRYEIDGDKLYILVQEYESKPEASKKWEAHKRYIDIQYVENGNEHIGYTGMDALRTDTVYDPGKDVETYTGEGAMLRLEKGCFVIFYPGEPHMPGVAAGMPSAVKKLVVKIEV